MISVHGLLFIEPQKSPLGGPVLDEATRKMTAAIRKAVKSGITGIMNEDGSFARGASTRGFHVCTGCGKAISSSRDYMLSNGMATNSMCVHYLAHHRDEVPQDQLDLVLALTDGELEPSGLDLSGATWRRAAKVYRGKQR